MCCFQADLNYLFFHLFSFNSKKYEGPYLGGTVSPRPLSTSWLSLGVGLSAGCGPLRRTAYASARPAPRPSPRPSPVVPTPPRLPLFSLSELRAGPSITSVSSFLAIFRRGFTQARPPASLWGHLASGAGTVQPCWARRLRCRAVGPPAGSAPVSLQPRVFGPCARPSGSAASGCHRPREGQCPAHVSFPDSGLGALRGAFQATCLGPCPRPLTAWPPAPSHRGVQRERPRHPAAP